MVWHSTGLVFTKPARLHRTLLAKFGDSDSFTIASRVRIELSDIEADLKSLDDASPQFSELMDQKREAQAILGICSSSFWLQMPLHTQLH